MKKALLFIVLAGLLSCNQNNQTKDSGFRPSPKSESPDENMHGECSCQ